MCYLKKYIYNGQVEKHVRSALFVRGVQREIERVKEEGRGRVREI